LINSKGESMRLLLIAETVTLAHLARPLVLAGIASSLGWEVSIACAERNKRFLSGVTAKWFPLVSISPEQFADSLAQGRPLYDESTLRAYVDEDRRLISAIRPDLVIGDFRLSLSVSARLEGVPYATITNAYWSPFANPRWVVPSLPLTRYLPIRIADRLFRMARPLAFALHTRPLNKIRAENGLPDLGFDLRNTYTDADYVLYADSPGMTPIDSLPGNHSFLGPVLWSPPIPDPDWWNELPQDRPLIYVTLGSSGQNELLPRLLGALADLPATIVAATAGKPCPPPHPPNAWIADYLPGERAASRARLVICNGGSPTTQQALSCAVPCIGICSNLDQFLNMAGIVAQSAGVALRADRLDPDEVTSVATNMLKEASAFHPAAAKTQRLFQEHDCAARFAAFLNGIKR
jgi:UDP:flavonoid glycosyltransferase YjiC (YdhE family)